MDGTPDLIDAFHRLSVKERNAHLFQLLVEARGESTVVGRVRDSVRDLCAAYPVYGQDGAPPR